MAEGLSESDRRLVLATARLLRKRADAIHPLKITRIRKTT
jgi:hypothetical protein